MSVLTARNSVFKPRMWPISPGKVHPYFRSGVRSGLLGHWIMWEKGDAPRDISGRGNHSTLPGGTANPMWSISDRGIALDFDGTDDYIEVPDSTSIGDETTASMSVTMWLKSDVALITKGNSSRALEKGDSYFFLQGGTGLGSGGMNFLIKTGGAIRVAEIGVALDAGVWYHLVGTFDGGNIHVYLDGVIKDTTSTGGAIDDDNLPLRIGSDDSGVFFNGLIGEVRIYNRALSAAEVHQLYSQPYADVYPVWWDVPAYAPQVVAVDEGIRHWQHQRSYPRGVMSGVLRGTIR